MRDWLRNLRTEKKMTMKEVGEKLGISESYYCAIENGDRQKNMDMMLASGISAVFRIPISSVVKQEKEWHRSNQ